MHHRNHYIKLYIPKTTKVSCVPVTSKVYYLTLAPGGPSLPGEPGLPGTPYTKHKQAGLSHHHYTGNVSHTVLHNTVNLVKI